MLTGCLAQIEGVVTDKDSGNPVAGAVISIGSNSAYSNGYGLYQLQYLPTGTGVDVLVVNAAGYELKTKSINQYQLNTRMPIDIELRSKIKTER